VRDQIYYPFGQIPDSLLRLFSSFMSLAVRTGVPPLTVADALGHELRGAAGDQTLYDVHSMEQLARASLERQRFLATLFGVFAGLALLLASIGIYGVLAYVTSQRRPEIGVRMALGADRRQVVGMVLRQSLRMILPGAAIGVVAAVGAARLLERLVAGVRAAEPVTIVLVVLVLLAAALIASFLPARRASRIDPLTALRAE
jgi:putative ABC transport system permease protein